MATTTVAAVSISNIDPQYTFLKRVAKPGFWTNGVLLASSVPTLTKICFLEGFNIKVLIVRPLTCVEEAEIQQCFPLVFIPASSFPGVQRASELHAARARTQMRHETELKPDVSLQLVLHILNI